ncbi:RNA-directed DNA polymerase, eukaryota, reverse transcriptase zinc-binding domain protein [Tanacetum coccineum]
MLFKVDFKKAFDSLSWNFLLSILEQMGFSAKWRNWIYSLLNSAFASVLVNKSPTNEFKLERGLRQGDPHSPFLFILAVEVLNIALIEATNNNIIHGVKVGLPIGAKMSRCLNWSPLVERFQKRLSKWKSKNLSFGGRLTLIRSVLGSLGVYYFSTFKAPKKTIDRLESIRRKFFWGGNLDENKIPWITWKKVISPINQGGLGIGRLKSSNQAMLSK